MSDPIKQAASILGKLGGAKGGRSKTEKKVQAVRRNLEKARLTRWPKKP